MDLNDKTLEGEAGSLKQWSSNILRLYTERSFSEWWCWNKCCKTTEPGRKASCCELDKFLDPFKIFIYLFCRVELRSWIWDTYWLSDGWQDLLELLFAARNLLVMFIERILMISLSCSTNFNIKYYDKVNTNLNLEINSTIWDWCLHFKFVILNFSKAEIKLAYFPFSLYSLIWKQTIFSLVIKLLFQV